jgi:hypothetical protein
LVAGSSGWFEHGAFAHALAVQFDAVGVMHQPVEDGIGDGGSPTYRAAID